MEQIFFGNIQDRVRSTEEVLLLIQKKNSTHGHFDDLLDQGKLAQIKLDEALNH